MAGSWTHLADLSWGGIQGLLHGGIELEPARHWPSQSIQSSESRQAFWPHDQVLEELTVDSCLIVGGPIGLTAESPAMNFIHAM